MKRGLKSCEACLMVIAVLEWDGTKGIREGMKKDKRGGREQGFKIRAELARVGASC